MKYLVHSPHPALVKRFMDHLERREIDATLDGDVITSDAELTGRGAVHLELLDDDGG